MAKEILRVTQVLSMFSNMWKIPEEVLARKGRLGTELHGAMFDYLFNGGGAGIDSMTISAEAKGYLTSFHEWTKDKPFEVKLWEERYTDEDLGLSGQIDAVFQVGLDNFLFDWKTAAKEDPVSWRLQGTAYIELLRRSGHTVSDTFYFLKLRKDGKRAETFAYKYTMEGWETFEKALDCAKYFQKWKEALPDAE